MKKRYAVSADVLPPKGVYTLFIFLSKPARLKIGKSGAYNFLRGYYAYTGSALGPGFSSLRHRVSRHLRKKKNKRWHIDYLLADENATVTAVISALTSRRLECEMNQTIKENADGKILADGFGASDCRKNCGSHLLYFGERDVETKVISLYAKKMGFYPTVLHPSKT